MWCVSQAGKGWDQAGLAAFGLLGAQTVEYEQREAQAAPDALVGTGPSAAEWRFHHHWGGACVLEQDSVDWATTLDVV